MTPLVNGFCELPLRGAGPCGMIGVPGVPLPYMLGASMRRLLAVSVLSLALCAACAHAATPATTANAPAPKSVAAGATTADARLNAWFERKYEEQLQFSPI